METEKERMRSVMALRQIDFFSSRLISPLNFKRLLLFTWRLALDLRKTSRRIFLEKSLLLLQKTLKSLSRLKVRQDMTQHQENTRSVMILKRGRWEASFHHRAVDSALRANTILTNSPIHLCVIRVAVWAAFITLKLAVVGSRVARLLWSDWTVLSIRLIKLFFPFVEANSKLKDWPKKCRQYFKL